MSLLDDEIKVMDSWDPSEQIYKDFIDQYMGGSFIPERGMDYTMFEYGKYSINREFKVCYIDKFDHYNRGKENPYYPSENITFKSTTMWCTTPRLHHIYGPITKKKMFILCSHPGTVIGTNNANNGYRMGPLCIMNFKDEELKFQGKPIKLFSSNFDDEIVLFNCNPKLYIPGFKVKRINNNYDSI
jgi:hypothetical protein